MNYLILIIGFCCLQLSSVGQNFLNEEIRQAKMANGEHIDYWPNGKIKVKSTITNYNLDGLYICYYNNGQVRDSILFIEGRIDGEHRKYNKNGQVIIRSEYRQDTLVSFCEFWYRKEQLKEERCLQVPRKDQQIPKYQKVSSTPWAVYYSARHTLSLLPSEGYYRKYYPSGQLEAEEPLVNDLGHGIGRNYWKDGVLSVEYRKKAGKMDGEATYYDSLGKKWKSETWKAGEKVNSVVFD